MTSVFRTGIVDFKLKETKRPYAVPFVLSESQRLNTSSAIWGLKINMSSRFFT